MKKICLLSCMIATSLTLAGCGGGGSGGSEGLQTPISAGGEPPGTNQGPPLPAGGNTGRVTAPFAKSTEAEYVLIGIDGETFGKLTNFTQESDGAVTTLSNDTLTGQTVVKEINGDASFALGRWAKGTVTRTSGSYILDGTSNAAYHYALINNLAVFPTSGRYQCDAGKFTAPNYIGGADVSASAYAGISTGSATLSFSDAGAAAGLTINTSAGGQTGTESENLVLISPAQVGFAGKFFSNGPGTALIVGDGGGGKILLIVPYNVSLANGGLYQGIAAFGCSP